MRKAVSRLTRGPHPRRSRRPSRRRFSSDSPSASFQKFSISRTVASGTSFQAPAKSSKERLVRVRRRTTSLKLSPSPFTAARARYASSERVTVFTDMSVLISTHGNKHFRRRRAEDTQAIAGKIAPRRTGGSLDFLDSGLARAVGIGIAVLWKGASRLKRTAVAALFVAALVATTPMAYASDSVFGVQNVTYEYEFLAIAFASSSAARWRGGAKPDRARGRDRSRLVRRQETDSRLGRMRGRRRAGAKAIGNSGGFVRAVIPAAGLGTRFLPLTKERPKETDEGPFRLRNLTRKPGPGR